MRNLLTKLISLLLILSLIVFLPACGQSPSAKAEDTIKTDEDLKYTDISSFDGISDPKFSSFMENVIYSKTLNGLNSEKYAVENIEVKYYSKEYFEELTANSEPNIYFGHSVEELNNHFKGKPYMFSLGKDGTPEVQEVGKISFVDVYDKVIKNIVIGTGIILVTATVSLITGGVGAPAISVIFAASASGATTVATSGFVIGGFISGITKLYQTGDIDEGVNGLITDGSEGFKWGAITGAITGGISKFSSLKYATKGGLSLNDVAALQKEKKLPLEILKELHSKEEADVFINANLNHNNIIEGHRVLFGNIDMDYIATTETGEKLTNKQLLLKGLNPFDSKTGLRMEFHHIGQKEKGTLTLLTQEQHKGNSSILHTAGKESEINREAFDELRRKINMRIGEILSNGVAA